MLNKPVVELPAPVAGAIDPIADCFCLRLLRTGIFAVLPRCAAVNLALLLRSCALMMAFKPNLGRDGVAWNRLLCPHGQSSALFAVMEVCRDAWIVMSRVHEGAHPVSAGGARAAIIQRGARSITRSKVISLPQHGHLGFGVTSGAGLGAGLLPRI